LGWRPSPHRRGQKHDLAGVVGNKFQIDYGVKSADDKPGVACYRRLKCDQVQALIVDQPMLPIRFSFEVTSLC
jgi:hypothetical protein